MCALIEGGPRGPTRRRNTWCDEAAVDRRRQQRHGLASRRLVARPRRGDAAARRAAGRVGLDEPRGRARGLRRTPVLVRRDGRRGGGRLRHPLGPRRRRRRHRADRRRGRRSRLAHRRHVRCNARRPRAHGGRRRRGRRPAPETSRRFGRLSVRSMSPEPGAQTMRSTDAAWGATANAEAVAAWDGPLFDRFLRYRHIVTAGLSNHGTEALRLFRPQPGQRVLDLGCGFGDTTQQIATIVGSEGEAVGIDASSKFIGASRAEAAEAGVSNASFLVGDVQVADLGGPYDMAFSRMGTMFFASPVAALRNVAGALKPGGRLVMVVWRQKVDNGWMYRAQQVVESIVSRPEEYDEPTCGPGPFSMGNADTVSEQLKAAGFEDISLRRCDLPILGGNDMDEALQVVMSIGPAGEILRLVGDRAQEYLPTVDAALRESFSEFQREDGSIWGTASTWIVTAKAPDAA